MRTRPLGWLALALLLLPACRFLEGRLPTERPALFDLEEPLALHEEPADEEERRALPAGGFTGAYVTDARRALEQLDEEPEGVLVQRVVENSPAHAAGLEEGDLLFEVDGRPLRWASEWRDAEMRAEAGQALTVRYDRAGADRTAELTVEARVEPADREPAERYREEERVGVVVRTATEVEARAAGLGPGGGAVVVGLSRSSPWREAGLRFEDLIVAVDGEPIAHPHVLLRAIREAPPDGSLTVELVRDGAHVALDAPVSRRARETKLVSLPPFYKYEKDRDRKTVSILLGLFKHVRTPAAYETRLLWVFKWRGGDADRLEEVEE